MNNLAIRRIIWKESRESTVLLVACGVAFALTMVGWAYSKSPDDAPFTWLGPLGHLVHMLNMWVNTLGILIGVILFAGERERRTDQRLAQLPVAGRRLVNTKILWAGCLYVAFIFFCYLVVTVAASLTGSEQLVLSLPAHEWVEQLLVPAECFFWGILWSMICGRTLYALFLATGSVLAVTALSSIFNTSPTFGSSITSWAIRIPVLIVVVLSIQSRSTQWLVSGTRAQTWSLRSPGKPTRSNTILRVLVWQSFRQFQGLLIVAVAWLAITFISQSLVPDYAVASLVSATVVSIVAGLFTFRFDCRDDRYRFFQQNVEQGRAWWFARMLPPTLIAVLAVLVSAGWFMPAMWRVLSDTVMARQGDVNSMQQWPLAFYALYHTTVGELGLLILSGLALGQYCSMMFRYPIVSFFACGCFTLVLACWVMLLAAFTASFWVFLFPLPIVLLGTTWWFAPRFLADRSTLWDRTLPWTMPAIVAASLVAGIMFWRAKEIPPIGIPAADKATDVYQRQTTSAGPLSSDPDTKSAQLMYRAMAEIDLPEQASFSEAKVKDAIVERHQAVLAEIHQAQATSRTRGLYLNPDSNSQRFEASQDLTRLLRLEFEYHMRRSHLDKAYQSLIALFQFERENMKYHVGYAQFAEQWSQHPKQTPELIKKALNDFMQHDQISRFTTLYATLDFEERCNQIQVGNYTPFDNSIPNIYRRAYRLMPWELTRTRHLGRHLIAGRQDWNERFDELFADNQAHLGLARASNIWEYFMSHDQSPYLRHVRTSAIAPWGATGPSLEELREIQRVRYIITRLALIAFMLEEGHYPERLNRLVPDYLPVLPCNPLDGSDFAYSGVGLDHAVTWQSRFPVAQNKRDQHKLEIRDGALIRSGPFLLAWSSTGSQRLYPCQLITEDKDNQWKEDQREDILCYNYPSVHWALRLQLRYELPPPREAPVEQ